MMTLTLIYAALLFIFAMIAKKIDWFKWVALGWLGLGIIGTLIMFGIGIYNQINE